MFILRPKSSASAVNSNKKFYKTLGKQSLNPGLAFAIFLGLSTASAIMDK